MLDHALRCHREAALAAVASLALLAPAAQAQTQPKKTPEQLLALHEAHKGDFDYLLGDWEFTAVRKTPEGDQKFRGYWSALRLDEGQVLDEYRVVSDSGETWYVTTTLRNYNAFHDRWELVGADADTGLLDFGTAHKDGAEMRIEQTFGVASDGTMEINGSEAALFQLEEALQAAASQGAVVLFARETPERDRAPVSRVVLQMVRDRRIPVRICRERDFSDALTPEGKLKPW